jgi:type IV pilus assembly protein PilB
MNNGSIIRDLLLRSGVVSPEALDRAAGLQTGTSISLVQALVSIGVVTEDVLIAAIAKSLNLEYLKAPMLAVSSEAVALLPAEFCRQRKIAPLAISGRTLRIAMANPLDYFTIQDVEFRTRMQVTSVVAKESAVEDLLNKIYGVAAMANQLDDGATMLLAGGKPAEDELDLADEQALASDAHLAPVVRIVNQFLGRAVKAGASDIHVEPQEQFLLVRDRVDGNLQDLVRIPKGMQDATISRLKIMAGMDIADRRRPQDGRAQLRYAGKRIDLRVSTLPTQYGEKVVMRILDSTKSQIPMEELGLTPENLAVLQALLSLPQGMILVTGPTGSGKTSTLYTALNWVQSGATNVITVEDPIEYRLPGINQVQINTKANVTFAAGLRSILRQDPNVIMVGEIRDRETASIAMEASQTGHLLLSTLHTNSAAATITRLIDLGIEPFMVASSVAGILAQRLVRRPCPNCKVSCTPPAGVMKRLGSTPLPPNPQWMEGKGCEQCKGSGYKGRMAIHELMAINDDLRDLITRRAPENRVRDAARRNGMRTLLEDGVAKAAKGLTTLEEVLLAVSADDAGREDSPAVVPSAGESAASAAAGVAEPVLLPGSKRVLIVEDSPTVMTVVKYFLEMEGFTVLTAADGVEGLEIARREHPHVVVSDLNMPGMDGAQLTRELRADPSMKHMAILILTSEGNVEAEERCLALGADDFLIKPVEPRRLVARVKTLLVRAQAQSLAHSAA